jgi:hypothetical protein
VSDFEWHDEEFENAILTLVTKRLQRVGFRFMAIIDRLFVAPKHGRLYRHGTVTHRASAAGEAPAVDTAALRKSVTFEVHDSGDAIAIDIGPSIESGRAEIAEMLEFGTSTIDPRPAWRPAFAQLQQEIEADMTADVER